MIYLASPYSHHSRMVRKQRFELVCEYAARLIEDGNIVFCPIAHSHPIADIGCLQTDFEYWRKFDLRMIAICSEVRVLRLNGWEQSDGIKTEIAFANDLGIRVTYDDPLPE